MCCCLYASDPQVLVVTAADWCNHAVHPVTVKPCSHTLCLVAASAGPLASMPLPAKELQQEGADTSVSAAAELADSQTMAMSQSAWAASLDVLVLEPAASATVDDLPVDAAEASPMSQLPDAAEADGAAEVPGLAPTEDIAAQELLDIDKDTEGGFYLDDSS